MTASPHEAQGAIIVFEDRVSDSPLVERVWRCHSERGGRFLSVASTHWELVVTRLQGQVALTVRGPETKPSWVDCPADGEWFAIRFRPSAAFRHLPASALSDGRDVVLPLLSRDRFLLGGDSWEFPSFESAESFVSRLLAAGWLTHDPVVEAVLAGERLPASRRTAERRIFQATGMTHGLLRQIERARHATRLIRDGAPPSAAAQDAGYFDQAHLTRSLRRLVGQTPGRIAEARDQLSFLYNTDPTSKA